VRPEQWETFKNAARRRLPAPPPVALIVDSPWIPGYVGISHLDYYADPEAWFQSNLKVMRDFPEVIFFPSWWVEYGMAIEPSALGNRIHFWTDQPPAQSPTLFRLEDVSRIAPVNPHSDGLMAWALQQYRRMKPRIAAAGYVTPVVTARGPLCLASFLRGVTPLMLDLVEDPDGVHRLLALTTRTVIDWLQAQADVIGDGVEGILVLDDIVGFLSPPAYRSFAHPYLKQICDAFPPDWVKVYHNDANVRPFLTDLAGAGFDVLNWSHKIDVTEVREKTKDCFCLMGNIAPLEIGVHGRPQAVEAAAAEVLAKSPEGGVILSLGGGVSPGMPAENIRALARAATRAAAP